jgi:hypothetical protein
MGRDGNYDNYQASVVEKEMDGNCSCNCDECDLPTEERKDCSHYRPPVNEIDDRRDV